MFVPFLRWNGKLRDRVWCFLISRCATRLVWTPIGSVDVEIVDFRLEDTLVGLIKEPIHPGEVLKELYLDPLNMGPIAFARRLCVPRTRIERLIKGTTGITPDTALRLGRVFNSAPAYWMNLQANHDLALAAKEINVSDIKPLVTA